MNRFSLFLVPLSLTAIGLAQPAQAQWTTSAAYYGTDANGHGPSQSSYGSTTITSNPVGTVKIASSPPGYPNNASGNYSAKVSIDCTWTGSAGTRPNGFSYTDNYSVSGSITTGPGYASSDAGNQSGNTSNGPYSSSTTFPSTFIIQATDTHTKFTRSVSIDASTSASYQGTVTANAKVTLGAAG